MKGYPWRRVSGASRSKAAPDDNEDDSSDNCADQWNAGDGWFARNREMEEADDKKDGEQTDHNRPKDPRWGTTAREQLSQKTNDSRYDQPYDKLSCSHNHVFSLPGNSCNSITTINTTFQAKQTQFVGNDRFRAI